MKTLAFLGPKGGVGTTTAVWALGHALAAQGHRVLLLDTSPSAHLTACFPPLAPEALDLGTVLVNRAHLSDILIPLSPTLALLPAGPSLAQLDPALGTHGSFESTLRRELISLADAFDYCLVDTPAQLTRLAYQALAAAEAIFVPLQRGPFLLKDLSTVFLYLRRLRHYHNPMLRLGGLFFTQPVSEEAAGLEVARAEVIELLRQHYYEDPGLLLDRAVRTDPAVAAAQGAQVGLPAHAPSSPAAQDYADLAQQIEGRLASKAPGSALRAASEKPVPRGRK